MIYDVYSKHLNNSNFYINYIPKFMGGKDMGLNGATGNTFKHQRVMRSERYKNCIESLCIVVYEC